MQVLFELRFYHSDKTDKMDRLIHVSGLKMSVKMNSVVKQLMYVLKLFRVTFGIIIFTLFGSLVDKRFRSCIQGIRFWIRSKESTSVEDHLDQ